MKEIDSFIECMINSDFDTMISVSDIRIECIHNGSPINFDQKKQTPPSQLLEPVKAYACGIMGWKTENFRQNIKKYGAAYHGGDGRIGFKIKGYSTVDVDNEEDFILAEAIAKSKDIVTGEPKYYSPNQAQRIYDADVAQILEGDGVKKSNQQSYNLEKVSLQNL